MAHIEYLFRFSFSSRSNGREDMETKMKTAEGKNKSYNKNLEQECRFEFNYRAKLPGLFSILGH